MLGVEDFQAEQDYHRGRLARALLQLAGTGTVAGLLVQTGANTDSSKLEIKVTAGVAIDRVGRIIEVPRMVCIVLDNWLTQYVTSWQAQQAGQSPGTPPIADPNSAIHDAKNPVVDKTHDTKNLMVDVFATFAGCTRGVTPCFASQDDYDATDAFSANRLLDSFAMQLVLRTDSAPKTPLDPWKDLGADPQPPLESLQQAILAGTPGPQGKLEEYPPGFDQTAVFLARILIPATEGTGGAGPTVALQSLTIDNTSRLFVIPSSILARFNGLGSGREL
jgi:hypothetical protein